MRALAANISRVPIHRNLSIDKYIQSKKKQIAKDSWQNHLVFILDEISIVFLNLLLTIDMHLSQAKGKTNNNTTVLSGLALVIVIKDFYQFLPVVDRLL